MRITPLDAWIAGRIGARGGVLNRESIACRQMEKLRETVGWAKARSPFYRERLAGVSGWDVGRPEDLARFPFTTEEDVRRGSLRFLCVSQSEVTRVVTVQTSGTSGSPKRIFFDADDQERAVEFFRNGMATVAAPGDRVLILLPGDRPGSVGDLLDEGQGTPGLHSHAGSGSDAEHGGPRRGDFFRRRYPGFQRIPRPGTGVQPAAC